jgi:hypothetical protein
MNRCERPRVTVVAQSEISVVAPRFRQVAGRLSRLPEIAFRQASIPLKRESEAGVLKLDIFGKSTFDRLSY